MQGRTFRRTALWVSAFAVLGMGSVTVACSPRPEKPAETSVSPSPTTAPSPSEKKVRPFEPNPNNPAVPCGFGPQGGADCGNNH